MNPGIDKVPLGNVSIDALAWRQVLEPSFVAEKEYILSADELAELAKVVSAILAIDTSRC